MRGDYLAIVTLGFGEIIRFAIPEIFRELQGFRMLAFGGIMTTMMVLKPEGLIPASRRKRELHERNALAREAPDGNQ